MTTSCRARVLSLAAAVWLLLAGCSSEPTATTAPTGSTTPTAQDEAVQMADLAFTPASVTVTPGSTVTWSNNDSVPHIVSFGGEGPQSSEIIEPGGTFEVTFEEAGSYDYVCTLHPGMAGVVEVNDLDSAAGADPTSTSSLETSATGLDAAAAVDGVELPGPAFLGVDIAQGEWALVPSAQEARPGEITFRFRNLGTVPHALRIRTQGSGGDRLEWRAEAVGPGESGLLVADLAPGIYEIDCPLEDTHGEHDELGMERQFTVHGSAAELAPLPQATGTVPAPSREALGTAVAITSFAFEPAELRVPVGTTVTWTNADPTAHTVTGDGFRTGPLEPGTTGTVTFDTPGLFEYFCAIHPIMQGSVVVEA